MIKIEYSLTSYEDLLRHISRVLQLRVQNNAVIFAPPIATGSIKLIKLPNGLDIMVYDYTPQQDIMLYKRKTTSDFFSFRIDDIAGGTAKSSIFFGNTGPELYHLASAGVSQKSINIMMSKDWLQRMLGREEKGDTILNFISLKSPAYHYEMLDAEYRRILNEMADPARHKDFEDLIVQNRVMLIMERFFTRLYKKIGDGGANLRMSGEEIVRLKLAEQALVSDFSSAPPGINQLSRIAAMSPSKLKSLFKKMYGLPVYQHFQKNRMIKAKAMLLSKKYTLQQVVNELGYNSVNDFSKMFQKTFDQSPLDI